MSFLSQNPDFDHRSVGLLQRLFLISDGTLTDLVEAAFLEPIAIRKLYSEITRNAVSDLETATGEPVLTRRIAMFGGGTGRTYVYAESLLALDRLPPLFREELVNSDKPLGRLWSEHKIETWKELLSMHRLPAGELAQYFGSGDLLTRTYRLISQGRPLMVISEYFPVDYQSR